MSRYSEEDKRRILEEARATLADMADLPTIEELAERELEPSAEDPVARWRREHEERDAERAAYRQREADDNNARRTRDWEQWADARIAKAIAEHDRNLNLNQVLGETVSKIRHEFRHAIAEAIGELRRELARAKAHDDGSLVDLPSPLIRKVRDNNAA
jgi:ABC-type Zn2+ transport system substrate-binding protein/surface adhesin